MLTAKHQNFSIYLLFSGGLGLSPAAAASQSSEDPVAADVENAEPSAAGSEFSTPAKTFASPENFCFGSPSGYPTIDQHYEMPSLSSFKDVSYFQWKVELYFIRSALICTYPRPSIVLVCSCCKYTHPNCDLFEAPRNSGKNVTKSR